MIGSALNNLTLNNTTFNSTFNQTSAAVWNWANTVPTVTGASTTVALSTSAAPTNPSGTKWVYTLAASESGAGSNGWAGATVTLAGYTGSATGNNGTSLAVTASTTTTVTVTNPTGTTVNTGTPTMISSAVVDSPILEISATINSGTAGTLTSIADTWSIQNIIGSVVPNPTSTLTFTHSGTSGVAIVSMPRYELASSASHWYRGSGYPSDIYSQIEGSADYVAFKSNSSQIMLNSGGSYVWASSSTNLNQGGIQDTTISRNAAGVVQIGTTAANTAGNLAYNRINTAGADHAGTATITAAGTSVTVSYAANYTGTAAPVVVVTPTSDPLAAGVPVGYWVVATGSTGAWTGFTINIQSALVANVTFNYIVVGKA